MTNGIAGTQPGEAVIEITQARIETLELDAIANSAGTRLRDICGGVDDAIRRAAGPLLRRACLELGDCPVGEARVTWGFKLPARLIVHTVAPKWRGGEYGELTLLAQCYENALRLADACGAMTMAFPAIGCGVRQFPKAVAMRTAIDALRNGLRQCRRMRRIHLSFQDDEAFQIGRGILDEQGSVFRTGEYWNEDWKRLEIETTDYWVTILGMCHHHWALIAPRRRGCSIFFLNDAGGVFDQIDLPRRNRAAAALAHNGFVRWGPGTSEATFINLPMHHPHHVGHQPVYSDGKGWNG